MRGRGAVWGLFDADLGLSGNLWGVKFNSSVRLFSEERLEELIFDFVWIVEDHLSLVSGGCRAVLELPWGCLGAFWVQLWARLGTFQETN